MPLPRARLMSWVWAGVSAAKVLEPDCPANLSHALLSCIGVLGYPAYLDRLVPAWAVPAGFLLGVVVTCFLCQLRWLCTIRAVQPLPTGGAVAAEVHVAAEESRFSRRSSGSSSGGGVSPGGRGLPRLRRGGGALA